MTFGAYVKQRRLALDLSLRKFTAAAGLDPSNYSKTERGVAPAPTGDNLRRLGEALGIAGEDWAEFEDLAVASRSPAPSDLDPNEVVAKLPLFFRMMRKGEKLTRRDLDELIEKVREA